MKSIINKQLYPHLTKIEVKLIDSINKSPEIVLSMNISEIAKEFGMSMAGITRLTKKLGFDKFNSLRLYISSEMAKLSKYIESSPAFDTPEAKEIFDYIDITLRKSLAKKDVSKVIDFASNISASDRIVTYGVESSFLAAKEIEINFSHYGLNVQATEVLDTLFMWLSQKNTKAIIFSDSMQNETLVRVLELIEPERLMIITQSTEYQNPSAFHYESMMVALEKNELASKYIQLVIADIFLLVINKKFTFNKVSDKIKRASKGYEPA